MQAWPVICWTGPYLGRHAHDETLLLYLVGLDGVVILQDLARVDELLRRLLPALLCANLLLNLTDGLGGLGVDGKFLLLEVLEGELHDGHSARGWRKVGRLVMVSGDGNAVCRWSG